jgi:hypothetical protein
MVLAGRIVSYSYPLSRSEEKDFHKACTCTGQRRKARTHLCARRGFKHVIPTYKGAKAVSILHNLLGLEIK